MDQTDDRLIRIIKSGSYPLRPIPTNIKPIYKKLDSIRAVLFDIYGTMLISSSGDIGMMETGKKDKIERLLKRFKIREDAEKIQNGFIEMVKATHSELKKRGVDHPEVRYEEMWRIVLPIQDTEELKEFTLRFEMIINPVYTMPFLRETLDYFYNMEILLGTISNGQFFTPLYFPALLDHTLYQLGFDRELIYLSFEYGHAKPSKHMYLRAKETLRKKNIDPKEVLYVGNDMINDIIPAKESGFKTALFAGDKRSLRIHKNDRRVKGIEPDIILTELIQLKNCIGV